MGYGSTSGRERYDEIWGDMGRYGEIWGDVERYGKMMGGTRAWRYGEIWGDMGRRAGGRGPRLPEIARDYPRSPEITREWVDEREGEVRGVRGKRRPNGSQRGDAHTPHKSQTSGWDTGLVVAAVWEDAGRVVAARMAFSPLVNGVPCARAGERIHGGGEDDLHLSAGQATW